MGGVSSTSVSSRPMITPVPPVSDKPTEEKTEALAAEADKIRKEYEEKLSSLQTKFEKEQSSKQKLQEELDKLEKEYSDKLDKVQEQYDHVTEAERIVNDFEKQGDASETARQSDEKASVSMRMRYYYFTCISGILLSFVLESLIYLEHRENIYVYISQ